MIDGIVSTATDNVAENLSRLLKRSRPPWESLDHRVDAMEKSTAAVFIHKVAGVYMNRGEGGRERGGGGGGRQDGGKKHEKDLSEHLLSSSFFTLADSYGK